MLLAAVVPASAYQYVGGVENCQQCHSDYTSGSSWHNAHTKIAKDDCAKCHNEQFAVPTANCGNCHSKLPCKWVTDHKNNNTETCMTCHASCQTEEPGCPASACLGQDDARIKTLQAFRDNVLAKTDAGKALIRAYYASSAALNEYLAAHPAVKASAGALLARIADTIAPIGGE